LVQPVDPVLSQDQVVTAERVVMLSILPNLVGEATTGQTETQAHDLALAAGEAEAEASPAAVMEQLEIPVTPETVK
jgi:hypothetical protein